MITSGDAQDALLSVAQVERRTRLAGAYSHTSGHLLLAGIVWVISYTAIGVLPVAYWSLVTVPAAAAAVIGSFLLSRRTAGTGDPAGRNGTAARTLWLTAACVAFIATTDLLFSPASLTSYLAFPALVMAFVYALIGGLGLMPRFLWIGAAIFAVTIAGLLLTPEAIAFWIAAGGGGGLVLGGLWLRKA